MMQILYVILIASVGAIIWAAVSTARHIRRGGEHPAKTETTQLGLTHTDKEAPPTDLPD